MVILILQDTSLFSFDVQKYSLDVKGHFQKVSLPPGK